MTDTRDGKGYLLAASDGGVFAYGNAVVSGSAAGVHLSGGVLGIKRTADGNGYWLVASDGGVFAYGDAPFDGSLGGSPLHAPIVGLSA
jgi:hypothetical protein